MFSFRKKFVYNLFRRIFHRMIHPIRATKTRSDLTPSILVLILFFVIIYYCGYRIHTEYKADVVYSDMRELWDLNATLDFGESDENFVVYDRACKIPRVNPFSPDVSTIVRVRL